MSVKQGVTLDFMSAETFLPVQDLVLNKLDRPQERLLHQAEHDHYECQQVDGDEDGDQCGEETVMRLVVEHQHTYMCTKASADAGDGKQDGVRDAPAVVPGLPLVDAEQCECRDVQGGDDYR